MRAGERGFLPDPAAQARLLVVEEEAAILDRRRLLHLLPGEHIDVTVLLRRDVGPEVPRTNTDLLADIVDTKYSPARVRAGNDKRALTPVKWLVDDGADKGLPLAFNGRDVELVGGDEVVDEGRGADGAGDDDSLGGIGVGVAGAGERLFLRGTVLKVLVCVDLDL